MSGMSALLDDLDAEHRIVDELVGPLDGAGWETPTPADGWAVRDQVGHLAWFDRAARLAVSEPETLAAELDGITEADELMAVHLRLGRAMDPEELFGWWRRERSALHEILAPLDPKARVDWFGRDMSIRSFTTARLMETWAHGQDVADALGVRRAPTARLRHVAHLGVLARPWAHLAHGEEPDPTGVFVDLTGPGGERWTWGEEGFQDRVRGPAEDFCLIVTQRRHLDDTALEITGAAAAHWMAIAQAFAGPPGAGRRPGQFQPAQEADPDPPPQEAGAPAGRGAGPPPARRG